MITESEAGIVVVRTVAILGRFAAVLFPIDLGQLLKLLPERGWLVPGRQVDEEGRTTLSAPVTKGSVELRVDPPRQTLGVLGQRLQDILDGFRELRSIMPLAAEGPESLGYEFVELRYSGSIDRHSDPIATLAGFYRDDPVIRPVADAINAFFPTADTRLTGYGLRLAPEGRSPNSPTWAEVSIGPMNTSGRSRYFFELIFRDPNPEATEMMAERAHEALRALFDVVERGLR